MREAAEAAKGPSRGENVMDALGPIQCAHGFVGGWMVAGDGFVLGGGIVPGRIKVGENFADHIGGEEEALGAVGFDGFLRG